jgi:hypothetical protein
MIEGPTAAAHYAVGTVYVLAQLAMYRRVIARRSVTPFITPPV